MVAPLGGIPVVTGGMPASGGMTTEPMMPTGGAGGGMEPSAQICSSCTNDIDCTELGTGARCTAIGASGSFCTVACGENLDPCRAGFTCLAMVNQCVPVNFDCTKCPAKSCADGEVCDVDTGMCTQPRTACQPCGDASNCADGLTCATLGMSNVCVPKCDAETPCRGYIMHRWCLRSGQQWGL